MNESKMLPRERFEVLQDMLVDSMLLFDSKQNPALMNHILNIVILLSRLEKDLQDIGKLYYGGHRS